MKTPDSQNIYANWLAQLNHPNTWQSWFNMATSSEKESLEQSLDKAGVKLAPQVLQRLQKEYVEQFSALWQDFLLAKPLSMTDRRFAKPAWEDNVFHSYNAASYLLHSHFLNAMVEAVEAPHKIKQQLSFATEQLIHAMSPANFLVSNPEAQQKMIDSKGESLARGMANMLADMQKGRISLSDESAFEVGKNVATTPGAVVFENAIFQLIQYQPLTKTVYQRPLLMVPPCINKFYILDLQENNSLVRYAVEQGHTVFMISWRNPDETMQHATWDEYVEEGVIQAIRLVCEISGQKKINTFGFCVGGTLLATALAVLAARGENPSASLTLLTTLLDFSDTGILDVFIDEVQVRLREQALGQGGLMPGRDLAATFSSLRPNDLVWNYVQSNYLQGQEPAPFDLLYWNADSTNLPGPLFCWYLRNMYLENNLPTPSKLSIAGEKIDLAKIKQPTFIYGSREDHIVPWTAAFASGNLLRRKNTKQQHCFVLGASGHIAGVVNPPKKNKRSYWTNNQASANTNMSAEAWLETATEHPGSWWSEWMAFLADYAGKQVGAPSTLGNATWQAIEPAPGRYVKVRTS